MRIYKITNMINGMMYIGQTVQTIQQRWRDHVRGDKQRDGYLQRAFLKYGVENFTVEEIDSSPTVEGLNVLEEHYILTLDTLSPKGYNLLPGGDNRRCHPDTKAKLSARNKGNSIPNRWVKGNTNPCSDGTKAKISTKLKGTPIAHRWTGGNKAPRTDAQKAYLSALNKGKPNVALYKPVFAVETGVIYESVNAAAKALNVNRVTISSLLKSGKKGRLGLSFKFVKE